ncbi:protein bassoon isoform X1 [Anguilla rostrata]|uniref:protein bassoon isoform X1 n=1 Tax=Anguilla rostrata TaxID=7938 RepID=UPI0030CCC708
MGNEASLEGGGQPGEPGSAVSTAGASGSISAPSGSGQLIKPSNGAAAGGGAAAGPGAGINRLAGRPHQTDHVPGPRPGTQPGYGDSRAGGGSRTEPYRLATHESPHQSPSPSPSPSPAQGRGQHAARRNLQVDVGGGRTGRSPSASPDRGSAPSSPYSVPQIAPMPSSKLCPVCNTTELTSHDQPNFNTCTQCHATVCNQCGFNPNPHLTEVQEWLCLNCQMQRALGMDMTTPRSKSQQQIHSPSHQAKPEPQLQPKPQVQPQPQPKLQPQSQPQPKPQPQKQPQEQPLAKAQAKTQPHSQAYPQSQPQAYPQSQPQAYPQSQPQAYPQSQPQAFPQSQPQAFPQSQPQSYPQSQPQAFPQSQPSPVLHRHTGPAPASQPGPHGVPASQHTRPDPQAYRGPASQSQAPGRQDPMARGPIQGMAKAPSQPDLSRSSPLHQPSRQDQIRSAGSSPARQPAPPQEQPQDGLTKLFGFGASLLNQASTLISADPAQGAQPQQPPARGAPKVVFSDATSSGKPQGPAAAPGVVPGKPGGAPFHAGPHAPPQQQPAAHQQPPHKQQPPQQQPQARREPAHKPPEPEKPKVNCPLCKTELNIGSTQPPNYNSCTQCHTQVCNLCGFNPTPHLVEKKEWLCLNCQTQRLMSGGLGDAPLPMPQSSPKHQPMGSPRHQPPAQSQQPAIQKATSQQQTGPKQQQQKPVAQGSGPSAPVKQPAETQQDKGPIHPVPASISEAQRHQRTTEKDKMAPKMEKDAETKSAPKKGAPEQITVTTSVKDIKRVGESQKSRHQDETNKSSTQDISRSPQSLSDTGYSSDGISSSHSEITGLIQEEEMKLSERGLSEHSPPSPSEIIKLESSMRPLLESKSIPDQEQERGRGRHSRDSRDIDDKKQRPRSLSITPEAFDSDEELEDILEEDEDPDWENQRNLRNSVAESSDEFNSKLRHDYVEDSSENGHSLLPGRQRKQETEMTDEEFMRRQILEMSADEDNEEDDEDYSYQKPKKSHKHSADSGKEKQRRLTHHSSSFEEESKGADDAYQGPSEDGDEDLMASQGGLRRFKTIELNNTSSYNRDMELSNENDLSLDREPELEMESLTGSPDERSRGEYSSTLPATTPSYTSGTSPTSVSSMEDDSDSSPSRRQRLEEAKQQRKARHRSHGPLLPTIEDSSEEDELREEEELLREQEKMREVEQQRIRSTARKTKRDKEELRAQRRRERSKTPPSNLSPIEDASPTEELRQAAEMEELHRSSCSEYSPSIDSEAEGFEISSKLYKSGSEYNLPTFMSLYSPTEKPSTTSSSSSSKPLKSAEEVYEEMMRKAEMLQKQQAQHVRHGQQYDDSYQQEELRNGQQQQYEEDYDYNNQEETGYENNSAETDNIYEEIRQTSQSITKMHQSSTHDLEEQPDDQIEIDESYTDKQLLDTGSAFAKLLEQNNALLTPGTSPTQLSAPVSFASTSNEPSITGGRGIPDVRVTQHFSKEGQKDRIKSQTTKNGVAPVIATTIAAYGVYSRDAVTVTQSIVTQTITTTQSPMYTRQAGAGSNVSSRIAEITQTYSQRDVTGRRATESRSIQVRENVQVAASEPESESLTSKVFTYFKGTSPPLSPTTSPIQSPKRSPARKTTIEFATQTLNTAMSVSPSGSDTTSPVMAQGTQTPHRIVSPRLSRQQSSQDSPFMMITLGSEPTSPAKPITVNSSTSPLSSPTRLSRQPTFDTYSPTSSSPPSPTQDSSPHVLYKTKIVERVSVGTSMVTTASTCSHGSLSMENISLCRISTVPGTSRVEQGQMMSSSSLVDLRTATKPAPIIMTDHGMDLTSLATEARKYSGDAEGSPSRYSTAVQPLVMNLNSQEHPHVAVTTVSITVAASMFISQPKQPVVYGDPMQNRVDLGQGVGSAVCLTQNKPAPIDPSIPKIDAKLEDLSIQQQQLQKQQQKLQEQQQLLEQQLQQHHQQQQQLQQQQAASFARYNLVNQVQPLLKKDLLVSQTSNAQAVVSAIPRVSPLPDPAAQSALSPALSHEMYGASGLPLELKSKPPITNLSAVKPQVMLVQMDTVAHGAPVSQLVKPEEPQDAMDLTGQIKTDKQVACCDVVYRLPFGGSCAGRPFTQKPKVEEKIHAAEPLQSNRPPSAPPQFYGSQPQEPGQESYPYQEPGVVSHNIIEERKPYQTPLSGRLQPSMSDSNLADAGLHFYQTKNDPSLYGSGDLAMDLSTMKQAYDGSYLSMGMQYGSYTDLRFQGDVMSQPLPIRRYSSMSNISTDYGYSSRDLSTFQESNLAHYSATTAREISRMCAALNSMEQFGGRYSNTPDIQYGSARGAGPAGRLNLQQGLTSMKANLMYGPDGQQLSPGQAYTNLVNARQATLRAMYPSAVRAADGMIYSTINTPIASTLPITTQPASVLRPMLRGVYRPYLTGNMTPVPLASLTRMPLVSQRMPLSSQGPYRFPPPNRFPTASVPASSASASTTTIDTPVYLGKPSVTTTMPVTTASLPSANTTVVPLPSPVIVPTNQQQPQSHFPMQLTQPQQPNAQAQAPLQPPAQSQVQPQVQAQIPPQTQPQAYTQISPQAQPQIQPQAHNLVQPLVHPHMQVQAQLQMQPQAHSQMQVQPQPQIQSQISLTQAQPQAAFAPAISMVASSSGPEKDREEERLRRQQEQQLQLERECVELEKLRQMRLQEELERERFDLQRHREKEQMLVQREIQELQSIKQQVLQQQQTERENQLVMQREQLAQQKMQLDQIQSLQQQLQQQLEEQKRQKTAAAAAATASASGPTATNGHGATQGVAGVAGAAPQGYSVVCDQTGRVIQHVPSEFQRTVDQTGQTWQPYIEGQTSRVLPSSASDISLRNKEEHVETRSMKKRSSMPRLRDGVDGEENQPMVKRIVDSSVQTDDEDGEERFMISRRRRTRRSVDCSVQTDDEDKAEWEQPVRRRRSRFTKHSDTNVESKVDTSKVSSSSIAVQTNRDCSAQTESEQLGRVSPAIHITTSDPKVQIVHYISAPERTQKGESLGCQTEIEAQSQGMVIPQLNVPTTIGPYSTSIQLVTDPRQQGMAKFERRKPDPLEISYQSHHLHNESLSSFVRQTPKSPQVLHSPVSPLSPHRLMETSFSSSERLNKAHVTPQKHFTVESSHRQQTLPRPIKNVQRSMSDPKPLSPSSEDPVKARFALYQQQVLQSQLAALQHSSLMRKVKRTLPSPPPEETNLPMISPAFPQMYGCPTMPHKMVSRPMLATKASLLKDITHELKVVEQESTKLRKQQAELEEEEKEIDAKLRYLELGINQRKETLLKERERRELAYIRCMGDSRDYMSDSELNNLRLAAAFESNGLLTRPSTAPLSQYSTDQLSTAQYPPTSSFVAYQYPQSQPTPQVPAPSPYQQTGFQPPPYPTIAQTHLQPSALQPQPPPPTYQAQTTYPPHSFPQSQPPYPVDLGVQPSLPGFQPPPGPTPYPTHSLPYPTQPSFPTGPSMPFQPMAEILTVHQRPRQTSLADLEQKMPTNYEVISTPTVVVTTTAQDNTYTSTAVANPYGQYTTTVANTYGQYNTTVPSTYGQYTTSVASTYGQYKPPETTLSDRIHSADSPSSAYTSDGLYSNLEQNIPRNYVMIDDISELTKDNMGTSSDMHKTDTHGHPASGRYGSETGPARVSSYGRTEEESEEDLYDHHGRGKSTSSYHQRGSDSHGRMGSSSSSMGGGSSYYYDDYKHSTRADKYGSSMGVQKHSSKSLGPAVVSSKRSKHRKQGMEQKISKFSPIEEAKDVESDLASYTITTSSGGSCTVVSRAKKMQDDIAYGLKKNVYDQQKYYGMSSREALEEDDRMYNSGRSRSTGYGMDKISSRDSGGHRSKSYERDTMDRSQRGSYSRGRPSMRSQYSEEESPLSPVGKPMGVGRGSIGPEPPDSRNQYGSSHSLPDVQDHMKDLPRSHVYKPDDSYIIDDMHCAVSDSEAYHLGQEETDWFEKPREARSDRSRHYGSSGHSSSQRRSHVKHTYHDYDEPPEEDLWPQDDYSHSRHSSSRDHRHHGSSGRHSSSSRHSSEDPRSSRSSRGHPKETSMRHDTRGISSSGKRGTSDSRSSQGYHGSDYSRDPSSHHHSSSSQRGQKQQSSSSHHQQTSSRKQQDLQSHPPSSRQQGSSQQQQRSSGGPPSGRQSASQVQEGMQQQGQQGQQPRTQQQQQAQASAARQSQPQPTGTAQPQPVQAQQLQAKPGQTQVRQPQATTQPATAVKTDTTLAPGMAAKPAAAQPAKTPQPPLTGIGSKAAPRPGGIGSAAAGQPAAEGESVLSKILPGGAAEQAGKLGEAVSAFGKKFTSFW